MVKRKAKKATRATRAVSKRKSTKSRDNLSQGQLVKNANRHGGVAVLL